MVTAHKRPVRALIVIGASTGGPKALTELFSSFDARDGVACLVVQHMPPGFTANLARRLNDSSTWTVWEGFDGASIEERQVYVAPGGKQMRVLHDTGGLLTLSISREEAVQGHQPSIDALFHSVASLSARLSLAGVILTGMGRDGALGLSEIRRCGGYTLAESAETAVIYGMPKVAAEEGAAIDVAPLSNIPEFLQSYLATCGWAQ